MLVYDSTNPAAIPTSAEAVAGYLNGLYTWTLGDWARFPTARKIGITVTADPTLGDAADVENFDLTPAQAGPWVAGRLANGATSLLVYCNRQNGPAVESSLDASGFHPGDGKVALWVATLDGTQSVTTWDNGAAVRYPIALVQYANTTLSGGDYDLSIVTTYGAASGVINPHYTEDDVALILDNSSGILYSVGSAGKRHVELDEWSALQKLGLGTAENVPNGYVRMADMSKIPTVPEVPAPNNPTQLAIDTKAELDRIEAALKGA